MGGIVSGQQQVFAGGHDKVGLAVLQGQVDADRGTCALVWRGSLLLRSRDEEVLIFVTAVPPGPDAAPTPWTDHRGAS